MPKPEKKLQDKVIAHLKERGIYYLNLYGDGMSGKGKPDVIVDFTSPKVIYENAKYVLENGVNIVIGTTGLTVKQREELAGIAEKTGANGLVAPNFSLGAVLLMKVSAEISKYMPNAEIIELHHNHKYDAPSGTAKLTAEKMAAARTMEPEADETKESLGRKRQCR